MAKGTQSGSIFFLLYNVDATWYIQETNVASPIFPVKPHFSRGVFDLTKAVTEGLTLPVTVKLTITPTDGEVPIPFFVAQFLTADINWDLTVGFRTDSTRFTVDQTTINVQV